MLAPSSGSITTAQETLLTYQGWAFPGTKLKKQHLVCVAMHSRVYNFNRMHMHGPYGTGNAVGGQWTMDNA
eukprot:1144734-Pelagomonas_calceolata.AAC.9